MKAKRIVSSLVFVALFFEILLGIQWLLQPNWESNSNGYARIRQFYSETTDPDVIFIGSSHVFFNINPLQMYYEQGFTSYNFSPDSLDATASELYVKEALRQGNPKLIAIDVLKMMSFSSDIEPRSRRWLDPLPLTVDKLKTIFSLYRYKKQFNLNVEYDSWLSYVFPVLRFHSRWSSISPNDFAKDPVSTYYHGAIHYHGYGPHYQTEAGDFSEYDNASNFDPDQLAEAKEILRRIVELCKKDGTKLLLIKSPSPRWRKDAHELISEWAEELDVPFVDFYDNMSDIGIEAATDFYDGNHLNDNGATKFSSYLGRYLKEHYELPDHRGEVGYEVWDEDWAIYQQDKAGALLHMDTDWESYVERLKNPNYTIYLAVRDNLGGGKYPELTSRLKELGLTADVNTASEVSYVAIIDGGEVTYECMEDHPVTYEADYNGREVRLYSASWRKGNSANIQIDGKEYFVDHRGLGIVVYDNLLNEYVDRVTFDLWNGGVAFR